MKTFKDYLNLQNNEEYSQKQLKIMEKVSLSEKTIERVKNIKKNINLLVVAEVFCPDCRAIVPFLQKFSEINDKIKIEYSTRDESLLLLKEKTSEARIPTIFHVINDKEIKVILKEFPKVVIDDFNNNPEKIDEIKYDFRTGKYNNDIEEEVLNYIESI